MVSLPRRRLLGGSKEWSRVEGRDGGFQLGPESAGRLRPPRDGDDRVWDYVVVEFMPGGSLADLLDRAQAAPARWPWRARLRVLCDVAEGMAQMHAKRYIHRDLKPDNVLIDGEGRAKIADLGLERTDKAFDVQPIASKTETPKTLMTTDTSI